MMEGTGYSLSDIRTAVDGGNGNSMFGGNGLFLLILFLFFFGFGGGMNRGGSDALTRAEMTEGFRNTHVLDGIEGVAKGVCQSTYALNNSIMGLGQAVQNCCCDTQKSIIENRYANEKNACDIVNAIHKDGEQTRALMRDQEVQKLRDDLQTAQLTLGNQRQTETLLSQLGKYGLNQPIWNCNPCYNC